MTDTLCLKAICQKLNSCRDTSFPLPDAIGKNTGIYLDFTILHCIMRMDASVFLRNNFQMH